VELDQVASALRTVGGCVLFGPGGIGKTSVAAAVGGGYDAVEWVDAETLTTSGAVSAAILDRLDPMPLGDQSITSTLLEARALLIVIDGAEGLGGDLVDVLGDFPVAPQGPWLLVTTRHLPAGIQIPIVRLDPFPVDDAQGTDAEALFYQHYAAAGGRPELLAHRSQQVQRLIRATGGVPGVLSLSAARAALVGIEDGDARADRTSDALFDRSLDRSLRMLDDDAIQLLQALGSAADQAPRPLAEAMSGLPTARVDRALESLARHALVFPGSRGVAMLPPVRRSARRKAMETGVAIEADRRHLAWCCAQLDTSPAVLVDLEAELRIAIGRGLAVGNADGRVTAMLLAGALANAWTSTLQHRRALDLLLGVLDAVEPKSTRQETETLVRLLTLTVRMSATVTGAVAATAIVERAERLVAAESATSGHRASLLCLRAELAFDAGALSEAGDLAQQARHLAEGSEARVTRWRAMKSLADVRYESGDIAGADALASEIVAAASGSLAWLAGMAHLLQGSCANERGAGAIATAVGRAELERCRQASTQDGVLEAVFLLVACDPIGNRDLVAPELADIGGSSSWIAYLQLARCKIVYLLLDGELSAAALRAADATVVAANLPHRWELIEAQLLLGDASLLAGDRAQCYQAYDVALTTASSLGSVLRSADALDGYAIALATSDSRSSRAAAGAAQAIRRAYGAVRRPRPWLPAPPRSNGYPQEWVRADGVTDEAVDALRKAAARRTQETGAGPLTSLSRSELAVARLVAEGYTNREIADRLVVSRRTVETHVAHAFQKLNVRTRTHLANLVTTAESAESSGP
jgi:DNA-binding CsgD family transcriptional regulator